VIRGGAALISSHPTMVPRTAPVVTDRAGLTRP